MIARPFAHILPRFYHSPSPSLPSPSAWFFVRVEFQLLFCVPLLPEDGNWGEQYFEIAHSALLFPLMATSPLSPLKNIIGNE